MRKHRFRESMKSFFGNHVDPEKDEQLKGTKIDIEEKVRKILTLIKNEEPEESDRISTTNANAEPLVELIEDFHKHYQNLYAQYDNLTGELRKKIHGKQENNASSSSNSDSDSDHSSKGQGHKNGQLESEFQKITDSIKLELETANLEIAELKRKLIATNEEKDALNSEYLTVVSKTQEAEEVIRNLKLEAESLETENSKLLVENGELKPKLDAADKIGAEAKQRLEDMSKEKDNLIIEKETAVRRIEEGEKIIEDLRSMVDQLREGNVILTQELETVRGEAADLKRQLESAEHQVSDLSWNLNASKEENESLNLKLSEALNEFKLADKRREELIAEIGDLEGRLGEKEREFSTLTEMHVAHGNESSARIKELEAQVTGLELELESSQAHNRDMDLQIEKKATEVKRLGEENAALEARILELEMISERRKNELSAFTKKLEDNENVSLSRIENLTVQVNNLLADMEALHSQKAELEKQIVSKSDEASSQVKGLMDQVNALQQELASLHGQKAELEQQLERRTHEISDYMIQIENLKEEMVTKIENQERVLQERELLAAEVKELESEVDSLCNQKSELEEQIRARIEEGNQLREEMVGLHDQIFELEKVSAERGLEFSALQEKHSNAENEASSQITALLDQTKNLQKELDSIQTQRNQLELQIEKENQEASERLTILENQNSELQSQITDQQRMLNEQGDAYNKLTEDYKQIESMFQEFKTNLEVAERKMEEMAEEFHKTIESKDQMVTDMKQMVEDLQRDLEANGGLKAELISQIAEQQRILEEQEDAFNKINEEYKQLEVSFQNTKASLEVKERKIQDLAEDHDKNLQSKEQLVAELEHTVEDMKTDLEMNRDEINSLVENVRNIEVKLRLSNQKLRVTEQLLSEKEESFRIAEAKYQEEQRRLEERVETLSGIIARNVEAHHRMITDISATVNGALTGFEAVVRKYEEDYRNHDNCILEMSEILRGAKTWVVEIKNENQQLKKEVSSLVEKLEDKREQESVLRQRVEGLQVKASKEEGEKENLMKDLKHLEEKVELLETMMKDKDDGILGLGEEKREAIRQLCLWIDYHRSRYDYLKEVLLKTAGRRSQRAT